MKGPHKCRIPERVLLRRWTLYVLQRFIFSAFCLQALALVYQAASAPSPLVFFISSRHSSMAAHRRIKVNNRALGLALVTFREQERKRAC